MREVLPRVSGKRAGISLVEAVVAFLILSGVTVVLLPTIQLANREGNRTRYLTHCLIEMQNLKDQALQRQEQSQVNEPPEHVAAALSEDLLLSAWFLDQYPEASVAFEPVEAADMTMNSPAEAGPVDDVESGRAALTAIRITITRFPDAVQDSQRKSMVMWIP